MAERSSATAHVLRTDMAELTSLLDRFQVAGVARVRAA